MRGRVVLFANDEGSRRKDLEIVPRACRFGSGVCGGVDLHHEPKGPAGKAQAPATSRSAAHALSEYRAARKNRMGSVSRA
jgi:hypothetical protein